MSAQIYIIIHSLNVQQFSKKIKITNKSTEMFCKTNNKLNKRPKVIQLIYPGIGTGILNNLQANSSYLNKQCQDPITTPSATPSPLYSYKDYHSHITTPSARPCPLHSYKDYHSHIATPSARPCPLHSYKDYHSHITTPTLPLPHGHSHITTPALPLPHYHSHITTPTLPLPHYYSHITTPT